MIQKASEKIKTGAAKFSAPVLLFGLCNFRLSLLDKTHCIINIEQNIKWR